MKRLTILLLLALFEVIGLPDTSHAQFNTIQCNLKAIARNDAEYDRDIMPNTQIALFRTNYFEYPSAFYLSDTIFSDLALAAECKNKVINYLRPEFLPPFFDEEVIFYSQTRTKPGLVGYYLAYYYQDSLIMVLSGDSTQYHFTVQASYEDNDEVAAQAVRFFNIEPPRPVAFKTTAWYNVLYDFEINGKRAELRGYNRQFRYYGKQYTWEQAQHEERVPDSLCDPRTREMDVIELVVYNE